MKQLSAIFRSCLLFILFTFSSTNILEAQFLKNIMNKAQDKLVDKVEDRVSDKIAEEIAAQAYKPIDKAFRQLWTSNLPQDSLGNVDWEKVNESYSDMLTGLDKSADLPEKYPFDLSLLIESKDLTGTKSKMKMHLSNSGGFIGIEQLEADKSEEDQLVIMDFDKDIISMYNLTENTGQAISSEWMNMALANAKAIDTLDYKLTKTGKTKKFLGYECQKYIMLSNDEETEIYLAEDFPYDWKDMYGDFMKKFAAESYTEELDNFSGLIMQAKTKHIKENKKSEYTVKEISEEAFNISTTSFDFEPLGTDH